MKTRNVLVVAAHPDDEALGCGGTIARHCRDGDQVTTLFLTDGVGARLDQQHDGLSQARRLAGEAAAVALGAKPPIFLDFPDNRLDSVALLDVTKEIEQAARSVLPEIVYTHHFGDLNVDHRIAYQAVLTAFRPTPGQNVKSIYGFEVPSSTEWMFASQSQSFAPTHFVDISSTVEAKFSSLNCYEMEMRPYPHPRSKRAIEALGAWRGAIAGFDQAEAFTVIRQTV